MARIDDKAEERLNDNRSRRRQDRECPLLVRDDGMLFPNVPLVAAKKNFRPYRGDPKASLADRLAYVKGYGQQHRRQVLFSAPPEPFDLGKASADEVVAFAFEEYGIALSAEKDDGTPKTINELRTECYRLSQLSDIPVPQAQGVVAPPPDPRPRSSGVGMNVPSTSDITAPPKPRAESTAGQGNTAGQRRPRRQAAEG